MALKIKEDLNQNFTEEKTIQTDKKNLVSKVQGSENEQQDSQILAFKKNKDTSTLLNSQNDKRRKISKFFYRVTNHPNLLKLGQSYMSDFKKGIKSFAITSMGYAESQQKTILAIASYFDHEEDLDILVVSKKLNEGYFKGLIKSSTQANASDLYGLNFNLPISRFYGHFDFVEYNSLFSLCRNEGPDFEYEDKIIKLLNQYDIIFWDVPNLLELKSNIKYYFSLTNKFESLSIIVAENLGKYQEVDEIKSFFSSHGVNIKGLIMKTNDVEDYNEENGDNDLVNTKG